MADEDQLYIIRRGSALWNAWRRADPDVRPDLDGVDLIGKNLSRANLQGADLREAYLIEADLSKADLRGADLRWAELTRANLSGANLYEADLRGARLVGTSLKGANLESCHVYAVSTWDICLDGAIQKNLRITPLDQPNITVDNLEVAQFLYLMLHNEKIRDVIDTLTSKVVLLLGRFTPERKVVLDALREGLRQRHYVPVLFDFEGSAERNFTETVTLLARMARFIIADLTEPASIPQELQAIVPQIHVPVRPIIAEGAKPYAMFADYRFFPWMLDVYRYANLDSLIAAIGDQIITPAEAKVKEIRRMRQSVEDDA